jgi:hypothetical protein
MPEKKKKDSRLERAGVSGYNKPKRTPNHPTKSHIVVAKVWRGYDGKGCEGVSQEKPGFEVANGSNGQGKEGKQGREAS